MLNFEQLAKMAVEVGTPVLANALMPGAPVVGRAVGLAASEILEAKIGENISDHTKESIADALHQTHNEIEEHNGYFEFTLPKHFAMREIQDHESGLLEPPDPKEFQKFLNELGDLRTMYGKPMRVSSCWRSLNHSIEARKPADALHRHYLGAVDILVTGKDALHLLDIAINSGWSGVGINQHGPHRSRFLHLDRLESHSWLWSY